METKRRLHAAVALFVATHLVVPAVFGLATVFDVPTGVARAVFMWVATVLLVLVPLGLVFHGGYTADGYLASMTAPLAVYLGYVTFTVLGMTVFHYVGEADTPFTVIAAFTLGYTVAIATATYVAGVLTRYVETWYARE